MVTFLAWSITLFGFLIGLGGVLVSKEKKDTKELGMVLIVVFCMVYFPILYLIGGFTHGY